MDAKRLIAVHAGSGLKADLAGDLAVGRISDPVSAVVKRYIISLPAGKYASFAVYAFFRIDSHDKA